MQTQMVALKSIVANATFNVRKNLAGAAVVDASGETDKDTSIEKLAGEIRRDGLINPLVIRIDDKGQHLLIAGFRRHAALNMLAKENPQKYGAVEVRVYDGDLEDAYFLNLTENTARNDLTPYEIGARCFLIKRESVKWGKDGKEMTNTAIADRVGGHSRPYISNLIRAFENLCPELLKRWEQESVGTAPDKVRYMLTDRISKIIAEKDHSKQLEMAVFDGLTWKEVKEGVKKEAKEGEKGEGEKGKDGAEGPARLSPKVIEETLDFVKSDEFKGKDHEATILTQALQYVLGKRKTLFGYDPEKVAEERKKEAEEIKAAAKEQKEAEKLAAKEAKQKEKAKPETQASA